MKVTESVVAPSSENQGNTFLSSWELPAKEFFKSWTFNFEVENMFNTELYKNVRELRASMKKNNTNISVALVIMKALTAS